ncbi:MAG: hypothetical protein OEQ12_05710 [Nitrosopumilus sp.]|nr:hypothetical protein [Nitrosopumilus sp.]
MIHEVEVSNLMFNKTNDDQINFKKYNINVELEEESSNEKETVLKYSLDLTSNPKNSVINISGNTILSGEQEEIEAFLKQEEQKTPEVVSIIYQELFPLMYIISKNMNIPSPAHTLSQNNVKEAEESEDPDEPNEKHIETKLIQEKDKTDNIDQTMKDETKTESNIESDEQEEQNDEKETQ